MRELNAEIYSHCMVDNGETYLIQLVFRTEDGVSIVVNVDPREALQFCSDVSNLSYKAVRFTQEAKERDEKRKQAHGPY